MCGIAGIVAPNLSPDQRRAAVHRMVAQQFHRGPDDEGIAVFEPAALGMRRLAIFDPAHGHQPMTTPDGRYAIVFNGAIYNFRELRAELEKAGHAFRTECDTEVLLAAYAHYGPKCLARLRGMFAFAVWDKVERRLFAARDPLGIKPLYYGRLPGDTVAFASELNALLASGIVSREIDPVAVGEYLAWFAVPAPRTIYRGVSNLPPGHSLTIDRSGRCEVAAWWQLPPATPVERSGNYDEFIGELRTRLDDTVRAHRLADVPVGAFLSGGLDSSAIVGLMSAGGVQRLKTFSLVFEETEYSEGDSARIAARAFGTEHHEEVLTGRRIAANMPRILHSFDQPTGDGINTYYVSEAAQRGGVKVALSGLGGDELFGGYPSFVDMPKLARVIPGWRQMPRGLRARVTSNLRRRTARFRKLADFLDYARDLHELCSLRRRALSETARLSLMAPEARRLAVRQGPNHARLDDFVFELLGADAFQIVSAWEMRTYMADVLLRDSDVFSMSHSLELRVPFVDRVFVEWWWNQPRDYKFKMGMTKSALNDAVKDVVPAAIRSRRKQGFALPYARWMRAELQPFLDDVFSGGSLERCPWLDAGAVQRDYADFRAGCDPQNWPRVWTVAILIAFANRSPT